MIRVICLLILAFFTHYASALTDKLPEPLKPWTDWVLMDYPDIHCPFLFNQYKNKQCSWSGSLQLILDNKNGQFKQSWTLYKETWISLPGDQQNWPQQVTANGEKIQVGSRNGQPVVYLKPGQYTLAGDFNWLQSPKKITLPPATGLLDLTVNGVAKQDYSIKNGVLWLNQQTVGKQTSKPVNKLDLQVFRKIQDDAPLQLITLMRLKVSGEQREIALPHALLKDFIPFALKSSLPARVEANGELRVQVKAGNWDIELHARHPKQLNALSLDIADKNWPGQEIWSFQAMPYQRLVEIENLTAIDPSQTNTPAQWRNIPAYWLKQGQTMQFKVIRRGNPDPEPNQLSLKRALWLDFDGQGYSAQDQVSGTMTRNWRLDSKPETNLGQVKINGLGQLITVNPQTGAQGVEVRKGRLTMTADSRLGGDIDQFSALGWRQNFQNVRMELNLPPGWRLLAVSGTDNSPESWLTRWTLLDLFLVLIAAFATARLWRAGWGVLALITLALIWHETDAPAFIWLNLLLATALLRVIPQGRFKQLIKFYQYGCSVSLLIIVIPFLINQVRIALYPQLELSATPHFSQPAEVFDDEVEMEADKAQRAVVSKRAKVRNLMGITSSAPIKASDAIKRAGKISEIDPNANIQTGSGIPQWRWKRHILSWNGLVSPDQELSLWYLSPRAMLWLNLLRVVLVIVLSLLMLGLINERWKFKPVNASGLLLIFLAIMPAENSSAAYPDQALLDQLQQRLLKKPKCLPACAQISQMRLRLDERQTTIVLEAHSQQHTAIPLPARVNLWMPQRILINGKVSQQIIRNSQGTLLLMLEPGIHRIELQGLNPPHYQFTLPLPLKPHQLQADVKGWQMEGLHENGSVDDQLRFTRIKQQARQHKILEPTSLPPFIQVEKTLRFGLDWRLTTRVRRLHPGREPIVLELPLLKGESVTTEHIRVKDNRVLVNMAANKRVMSWQSILAKTDEINLTAAATDRWMEVWKADISPIWHIELNGISVVHHQQPQGQWLPEWRPWPGEQVRIKVSRPQTVVGPTLTIDRSELLLKPGKRSALNQLDINLRSSKGGQHAITLPEDSQLQSVNINNIAQPIRLKGRTLTLPIKPGSQSVQIKWHQNQALSPLYHSPEIDLATASVNHHIRMSLGDERWVLFTWGPQFGPAALIWGVLCIIALLAYGLGKIRWTPLKAWQWFLLLTGLSQVPVVAGLIVIAWLLATAYRGQNKFEKPQTFNLVQIGIVMLTVAALLILIITVQQGLLGSPDMQIAGNQSSAYQLKWYQDRTASLLPTATVLSLPMLVYRLLMLLWSLWLAASLLNWLQWGWRCFSKDQLWRKSDKTEKNHLEEETKPEI